MSGRWIHAVYWDYNDNDINCTLCVSKEAAYQLAVESTVEIAEETWEELPDNPTLWEKWTEESYERMRNADLPIEQRFNFANDWRERQNFGHMEVGLVFVPEEVVAMIKEGQS